jgi:hypothetical protein
VQDDSIYRDFHWARDELLAAWAAAEPHLTSNVAIHLYVEAASVAAMALSLFIAYRAKNRLRELRLEAFDVTFPGRSPKRAQAIQRRINEIRKRTNEAWLGFARDFALLFLFGLCVPAAGLYLLCTHYGWFDLSGLAFIDLHDARPVQSADTPVLVGFVINQIAHGALLDFPEVFAIDFGRVTSNPSNLWFSSLVLAFRTIVGGFSLALAVSVRDTLLVLWRVRGLNTNKVAQLQAAAAPAAVAPVVAAS